VGGAREGKKEEGNETESEEQNTENGKEDKVEGR
jgi:hypothetical protein